MNRYLAIGFVVGLVAFSGLFWAAGAYGKTTSPKLRTPSTECSWSSNGQEIVIDGYRYICTCERVAAINEIWCTLINLGPVENETRKTRVVKKHPKKPVAVKPRYGISTGALNHA